MLVVLQEFLWSQLAEIITWRFTLASRARVSLPHRGPRSSILVLVTALDKDVLIFLDLNCNLHSPVGEEQRGVGFFIVYGHGTDARNERCERIAADAVLEDPRQLAVPEGNVRLLEVLDHGPVFQFTIFQRQSCNAVAQRRNRLIDIFRLFELQAVRKCLRKPLRASQVHYGQKPFFVVFLFYFFRVALSFSIFLGCLWGILNPSLF